MLLSIHRVLSGVKDTLCGGILCQGHSMCTAGCFITKRKKRRKKPPNSQIYKASSASCHLYRMLPWMYARAACTQLCLFVHLWMLNDSPPTNQHRYMCSLLLACTESIILTINQNLFFTPLCGLIPQRGGTHPFKKKTLTFASPHRGSPPPTPTIQI